MSLPWTLAEAVIDWQRALDEAARIGAPWDGTRFAEYLLTVETARDLEASADRRAAFAPFRANKRNGRMLYEAAGQMMQLVLASRVWNQLDPDLLVRKLRTVMKGDPLPNPRGVDDHPRDTLVELLAASLLTEAGFSPTITENEADIELKGHGFDRVVVECKRPTSLGSALATARRQLWKRTHGGQILGIPVFAIESALNLPFQRHVARSERELDDALNGMFDECERIIGAFARQSNGRYRIGKVAPLLLVVISGAVLLDDGGKELTIQSFTSVRQFAVPDGHVPSELAQALQFERRNGSLLSEFR